MLTTRQVADKLKVSTRHVRAIRHQIGSWKLISGMLWFDPRAVEAFIKKRERKRAKRAAPK